MAPPDALAPVVLPKLRLMNLAGICVGSVITMASPWLTEPSWALWLLPLAWQPSWWYGGLVEPVEGRGVSESEIVRLLKASECTPAVGRWKGCCGVERHTQGIDFRNSEVPIENQSPRRYEPRLVIGLIPSAHGPGFHLPAGYGCVDLPHLRTAPLLNDCLRSMRFLA